MTDAAEKRLFQAPPRAAQVYAQVTDALTLGALEKQLGYTSHGTSELENEWLELVRRYPMRELADDDLAMLLARAMHLPVLLPIALQRLRIALDTGAPPSTELVRACGPAAALSRRAAPDLYDQTAAVLQNLLRKPWIESRDDVLEAACDAIAKLTADT